jgi:hypothetical protein
MCGDMVGVWIEPVTAQVMTTLLAMDLPCVLPKRMLRASAPIASWF